MQSMRIDRGDGERLRSLGAFVRARRESLGLTQMDLGRRIGYYQERVSAIERGVYGLPSLPAMEELAAALEVDLCDLVEAAGFSLRPTSTDGLHRL
jgi:transcriptional regulator with XRE-family HTH domain